jgi:hypothetical protein
VAAEVVLPDRMHVTTEAGSVKSEAIYIGEDSFMRANGGAWEKAGLDMSDRFAMFRDTKMIDAIAAKSEVEYLGGNHSTGPRCWCTGTR